MASINDQNNEERKKLIYVGQINGDFDIKDREDCIAKIKLHSRTIPLDKKQRWTLLFPDGMVYQTNVDANVPDSMRGFRMMSTYNILVGPIPMPHMHLI